MTVLVDAAAGVVVEGAVHWPLRLDCRTGTAVLTVGDRELAVAPLRWRDKQRLARWAHLGPAFVAEQSVELAVPQGTVLDDETRPLVAAVADFLNGDALPLSPELLSEVAVGVCRLTGLAPAAFDDRDAIDVESAWRSAAPAQPSHPAAERSDDHPDDRDGDAWSDPWADATRIVITPDPPDVDTSPTAHAAPADDPLPEEADRVDPPPADISTLDRAPAPKERAANPFRDNPPQLRARSEGRRAAQPYRIAPVQAPRPTPPASGHAIARDGHRAVVPKDCPPIAHMTLGPSATPQPRVGGPLVAPVAAPPNTWAYDAATGRSDAPAPSAATGDTDDHEVLEALTAAVAERLADQLVRASHDLGIEV